MREKTQGEQIERIYREELPEIFRCLKERFPDAEAGGWLEDVVQEAFLLAWQRRELVFRKKAPARWIRFAAYRLAVRQRELWREKGEVRAEEGVQRSPEEIVCARFELKRLLENPTARVLTGRYLGYSYRELAGKLAMSECALRMRVSRGREKLRTVYGHFFGSVL